MDLHSDAPPLHSFQQDKPTLLVCWWITAFSTVVILLRLGGRFVRTERLFTEDKWAAAALVPLYMRMACVHIILLYGTNNARFDGVKLSNDEIYHKQIASGLVLLSRIFYAATLWILKNTILEFFKRLNVSWQRTYGVALLVIRCTLIATFVAVVVADLSECQPFSDYWRITPDPGGRCRQGYAQLLTMAACNVFTDLLLVFFPIPIIIQSQMSVKRKIQLVLLFSLSLAPVAVTLYRIPHIIWAGGSQQLRSLFASIEIFFATGAANMLVLGSFVRDRGVKKRKYKHGSVAAGSMDPSSDTASRRPTVARWWGSDEDLVRDVGFGLDRGLQDAPVSPTEIRKASYTPAPVAQLHDMNRWQFPENKRPSLTSDESVHGYQLGPIKSDSSTTTGRRVSFFDVGGLLEEQRDPTRPGNLVAQRASSADVPPLSTATTVPTPSLLASGGGLRRGSITFLQDIGALWGPLTPKPGGSRSRSEGLDRLESMPEGTQEGVSPLDSAISGSAATER